jgi:hypothetical protein
LSCSSIVLNEDVAASTRSQASNAVGQHEFRAAIDYARSRHARLNARWCFEVRLRRVANDGSSGFSWVARAARPGASWQMLAKSMEILRHFTTYFVLQCCLYMLHRKMLILA